MAAMAFLSVFLISFLALTVQGQTCDRFPCLPRLGGTCNNGRCECPGNQIGDGSIDCVDPNTGCLCSIRGDPHISGFDAAYFPLLLACGHRITEFTTNTGCTFTIEGVASYIDSSSNPVNTFETRVDVRAESGGGRYEVQFFRGQDPVVISPSNGPTVDFSGDVKTITFSFCGVRVSYDSQNAGFSVAILKPGSENSGICQTCTVGQYNPSRPDLADALTTQLANLRSTSVINNLSWNHPQACDDLASAISTCGARQSAEQICGSLYTNQNLLKCLVGKESDPEELLNNFRDCFRTTCRARGTPLCMDFTPYFKGCDISTVAALSDPSLCIPTPPTRPPRGVAPPGGSGTGSWSGVNIDRFNP